jgi:hypothetical protein
MSPLVKTKRQANFKDFKRFGAFKGLVEQKSVVFNPFVCKLGFLARVPKNPNLHKNSSNKLLFFSLEHKNLHRLNICCGVWTANFLNCTVRICPVLFHERPNDYPCCQVECRWGRYNYTSFFFAMDPTDEPLVLLVIMSPRVIDLRNSNVVFSSKSLL